MYPHIYDDWSRNWQPIPVFLPGEFHGQRNLGGYSPWGCKELDTTKPLTHTHMTHSSPQWETWGEIIIAQWNRCSLSLVQFSSVTQSCPTLGDPMDCSMPGFPVHHQLLGLAQTHIHRVSDAIQSSHPLSTLFTPDFNLFQQQGLFKWVSSSQQVPKVLELQLQQQSFQWIFRTNFL